MKPASASFLFYRDNSADLAYQAEHADVGLFTHARVFHFCSNTLTKEMITETTAMLIAQARQAGAPDQLRRQPASQPMVSGNGRQGAGQ